MSMEEAHVPPMEEPMEPSLAVEDLSVLLGEIMSVVAVGRVRLQTGAKTAGSLWNRLGYRFG